MLVTQTGLRFIHLYSDEAGETHLGEIDYSMATTKHGLIAENIASDTVGLRVYDGGTETTDFETSPRRQLVIPLAGRAEIEASDGTRRVLEVGTILLAEDTVGRGHLVRELDQPRLALVVPLLDKKRAPTGLVW
jgi:hypothetical protein